MANKLKKIAPRFRAAKSPGRDGLMPDKGKKDGSCNRTACQRPLRGKRQYYMRDYMVQDGRLYYCEPCEREFTRWDRIDRPGEELRCTLDPTTADGAAQ